MAEHDELLTRTFELAAQARDAGDHPFSALLAIDGEIVAEALNRVSTDRDLTAHAETMLVRILEREGRLGLLAEESSTPRANRAPCASAPCSGRAPGAWSTGCRVRD